MRPFPTSGPLARWLPLLGALLSSCADEPARRDCVSRIWVPRAGDPRIAMAISSWEPTLAPVPFDEDWAVLRLDLPPGEHGYQIVRGGERSLDPGNPLTTFRSSGEEVSLLLVPDCAPPALSVAALAEEAGEVRIEARFLAGRGGAGIDPASLRATTERGEELLVEVVDEVSGELRVVGAVGGGRRTIEITAADEEGTAAAPARLRVWADRLARDRRDEVLYQVVVDRFRGDGGVALSPPRTPGARAGGTLDGVRSALEDGTFERLGVTTIWLSPVYDNPDEERPGRDGRMYEGYHGYWNAGGRVVEPLIGGEEALRAVTDAAHARGIAVLLDIVPNHVDETNPIVAERAADGWFNEEGCVCGSDDCPWGENLQVCWFTPYLPDLRLEAPAVTRHAVAEARFWLTSADVDGVRVDAVPMMPRAATRRILRGLRETLQGGDAPFLVGEVFTGPGIGALEEIRAQIGAPGLDSAFAFPLMWALRGAIAGRGGSFADVEAVLAAEDERFAGSGVILGRILDNHDVSRFVSVAHGDDGGDPWDAPAEQPEDPEPYERMAMGLVAIFALPGMPTIFQGDEVGLAGSGDPDNRRVMPDLATLPAERVALHDVTARLASVRRCADVLRRGDRVPIVAEPRRWAFARSLEGATAFVVMSTEDEATTMELRLPGGVADGDWVDALTGEVAPVRAGAASVSLPPRTARLFLPAGDGCLAR